ncbi:MAG: hypothetical protein WC753_04410 [Candidatus Gracilibacteria bacterium]
MVKKISITLAQVMAILALLGISLSVVGTAWIGTQPLPRTDPLMSGEQNIQIPGSESPAGQK